MARVALISTDFSVYSMGTRALSAYLKRSGHSVVNIFMPGWKKPRGIVGARVRQEERYSPTLLARVVREVRGCDLIGLTSTALTKHRTLAVIDALRPLGVPMVWGGIYATTCPQDCLEHVDIVCIGEGEEPLLELVERVERGERYDDVPNLWVRRDGAIAKNQVRPLIQDLDALPFSDFDLATQLVAIGDSLRPLEERDLYGGWLLVHGTRGCAFACTYCCNRFLQKLYGTRKLRHRSVDNIIDEVVLLKERFPHTQRIWFTDDDFFVRNLSDLKRFAAEYNRRAGIPFQAYVSPTTLREDKLKLLLGAGLKKLEMGIQGGSERVAAEVYKRPMRRARIIDAARLLYEYRAFMQPPNFHLLLCNPFEEQRDLLETISLLRALPPGHQLSVFVLSFFPGTELAERARQEGFLSPGKERQYLDHHYLDLSEGIGSRTQHPYLNSVISWMEGLATPTRRGLVPTVAFDLLLHERCIELNQRFRRPHQVLNRVVELRNRASEHIFMFMKDTYAASPALLQRAARRLAYRKDLRA